MTLEQLRHRMPELRRQEKAAQSELLSLTEATTDQSMYMRLVETLAQFRERLRARADSLDVGQRQKILRLLVKEILVGKETIAIRHSIPAPHSGGGSDRFPEPAPVSPIPPTDAGWCYDSPYAKDNLRRTAESATREPVPGTCPILRRSAELESNVES